MPLGWGVNACTTFVGTAPLKIWKGKKRAKFSTFYDNFQVWVQISLEPMKTATKSKRRWQVRSFRHWTKLNLWNSVHNEQSYRRSCWPTLSRQCALGVCQCIWVRATWLWCRGNSPPLISPQSDLGRWADSRWALPQISSFLCHTLLVECWVNQLVHKVFWCVHPPRLSIWATQKHSLILGASSFEIFINPPKIHYLARSKFKPGFEKIAKLGPELEPNSSTAINRDLFEYALCLLYTSDAADE